MSVAVGDVLHDPSFVFRDGERGNKLLVVLGLSETICLVARTTSKQHRKSRDYGCQPDDFQANFYLPREARIFLDDTWICLDYLTELDARALIPTIGKTIKLKSRLTRGVLRDLLECVLRSEDITKAQESLLQKTLAVLPPK